MSLYLPSFPKIPYELSTDDKKFLETLEGRIDDILAASKEAENWQVLGHRGGKLCFRNYGSCEFIHEKGVKEYVFLEGNPKTGEVHESPFSSPNYTLNDFLGALFPSRRPSLSREERSNRRGQFFRQVDVYLAKNRDELSKKIKHIRIYQATIPEVERITGKELEIVDTKRPEQFIECQDSFWLRVQSYQLGADAVVHYQPGSAIGTPVRFKKEA